MLDERIVPLASAFLGFLGSDSPSGEPLVEVTGMVLDVELALDDLGEAPGRPQFGGESEGLGILANPAEHACLLLGGQPGRPTGMRLGGDALDAMLQVRIPPLADRRRMDAQNLGHDGRRFAFLDRKHRLFAELLQLGGGTSCSHAQM